MTIQSRAKEVHRVTDRDITPAKINRYLPCADISKTILKFPSLTGQEAPTSLILTSNGKKTITNIPILMTSDSQCLANSAWNSSPQTCPSKCLSWKKQNNRYLLAFCGHH